MAASPAPVAVASGAPAELDRAFFGHPRGLSTLFFTEMWERFSYYGTRALLILFMTAAPAAGGMGLDTPTAGAIYGLYTSMAYMASMPGGWIADRLIGPAPGGALRRHSHRTGECRIAIPTITSFYAGLTLIVLGTGLLKPNVSAIVGQLYATERHAARRGVLDLLHGDQPRCRHRAARERVARAADRLAPRICRRLRWDDARCDSVRSGRPRARDRGTRTSPAESPAAFRQLRRRASIVGGAILLLFVAVGAGIRTGVLPITPTQVATAAGYLLLITVVLFFVWLFFGGSWTPDERKRLYAIGCFFVAATLFWSVFEQAGSTLNLFAARNTFNRIAGFDFPSSWYLTLNSAFLWIFAPVFAWLWIALGRREPTSPVKFALGLIMVGIGFAILIPAAAHDTQRLARQSDVAHRHVPLSYVRRTAAEPRRTERDDETRAGTGGRPDDGGVVPRDLGRQLCRWPAVGLIRVAAVDPAVRCRRRLRDRRRPGHVGGIAANLEIDG